MKLPTLVSVYTLLIPTLGKNVYKNGITKFDFSGEDSEWDLESYHRRLARRDDDDDEPRPLLLNATTTSFLINATFGTPGQRITMRLLTELSDSWVSSVDDSYCDDSPEATHSTANYWASQTHDCDLYGAFDANMSDSFKSNNTYFEIGSTSGQSFAQGEYVTDTITIGDYEVKGFSFGLANASTYQYGVLGLGLEAGELTNVGLYSDKNYTYSNFPSKLKEQGYIKKRVYSFFFNSQNTTTGSIIFGGIDHAKYSGELVTLPVINIFEDYGINENIRFPVTVSGVGTDVDGNEETISSMQYAAFISLGTSYTYLPVHLIDALGDTMNISYVSSLYGYGIDCPSLEESLTRFFVFDFQGHKIRVPLYQMLRTDFRGKCALSIAESSDDTITLGAAFLSAVYAVFDLDDQEVSIAQAKYTEEEDIEAIESSVPSAVKAPEYSSTWSTTYLYATTTENIFSDEDDGTTAVDVFGYTGGKISRTRTSSRFVSTSRTSTSGTSTSRISRTSLGARSSITATETTSHSVGRSTDEGADVSAEGSSTTSDSTSSSGEGSSTTSNGGESSGKAVGRYDSFTVIPLFTSILLTLGALLII